MIQTHSAIWLMLNKRPETVETGLNFLPTLYYYAAGSTSQGKVVVNGSLQCSNKIITTDNWRNHNQWQMRCIRHSYFFNWTQFPCPHEHVCSHSAHSLTLYPTDQTTQGVSFSPFDFNIITAENRKQHKTTVWDIQPRTYKQKSCQMRQDLSPAELLSCVFLYH